MVVRPGNVRCFRVFNFSSTRVALLVLRMEVMGRANSAKRAKGYPKILVVAGGQQTTATLPKSADCGTIVSAYPSTRIYPKKPELLEIGRVKPRQDSVVAVMVVFPISANNLELAISRAVTGIGENLCQHRETLD